MTDIAKSKRRGYPMAESRGHDHVHRPADAEHPAQLRPVRTRGDGSAHPRQGCRLWPEGNVDGRRAALRLPRDNRKLVVDDECAANVHWIFARFLEIGLSTELAREVAKRGIRTPCSNRIDKKYLYRMLNNRAYIGEAAHKGESYPGEHDTIKDRETWDRVHAILKESPRKRAMRTRADTPALLKGLLFGPDGAAFSPTYTRKGSRPYRYYVSQTVLKHGAGSCPVGRVTAGENEAAIVDRLRAVFRQPEIVAGMWKAAHVRDGETTKADTREALTRLGPLWDEIFPAEQARIVALLVERIDIGTHGLNVCLRMDGLTLLTGPSLLSGRCNAAFHSPL